MLQEGRGSVEDPLRRNLETDRQNKCTVSLFKGDRPFMRSVYVVHTTKYQHGLCLITPTGPDPNALGNRRKQWAND